MMGSHQRLQFPDLFIQAGACCLSGMIADRLVQDLAGDLFRRAAALRRPALYPVQGLVAEIFHR